MLDYSRYQDIAEAVYNSLQIPEDKYLQFKDDKEANDFIKSYSEDYIADLVNAELSNYDTSENHPAEVEDIRETAIDEVMQRIDQVTENYYYYKRNIATNAYSQIVDLLQNSIIDGVEDVDTEFDPADPDVGLYHEERRIQIKLVTGDYITFNVEFEEE